MLFGPLLSPCRPNSTSPTTRPGCSLGAREVDPHLDILEGFGASIEWGDRRVLQLRDPFAPADHWLDYQSVTTTEHFVMCAARARGTSTLVNAASEPHVQDLCQALVAMGASIDASAHRCCASTASTNWVAPTFASATTTTRSSPSGHRCHDRRRRQRRAPGSTPLPTDESGARPFRGRRRGHRSGIEHQRHR